MTEELEIFLEDCDDQLQLMEDALVDMQSNGPNENSIGAMFRAVHTIKGSAGMFGFNDIVVFTHTGENLFEILRKGTIKINDEMLSLFLECKDYINKLIQVQIDGIELDKESKQVGVSLVKKLNDYINSSYVEEAKEEFPQEIEEIEDISNELDKDMPRWHISIRLKKDFFTTGMSIHSIFNFLNKMGKIIINHPIIYDIPIVSQIEALKPYIGFELLFQADTIPQEIEEVFEFVIDDVDLIIFKEDDKEALASLLESRDEEKLEENLIEAQFYEDSELSAQEDIIVEEKIENIVEESVPDNKKEPLHVEIKKPSSTLRVDSTKIDLLINYMSEMVIANSKILTLVEEDEENIELQEASTHMRSLLEYVRDGIMDMRMVQVGDSFNKFRRIVNDTSKKIGKDVEFVISGGETELDKTVVEKISDPLLHMLRNSIDHGIEMPEERVAKGKTAKGRVDLRAYPDAGTIVIEIQDNGKGLDKDKILAKAIDNGSVKADAKLSDAEIYKLIFAAGLSTAEKVSDISGRGVGMDVVRRNIEDLRGTVDIDSTMGKGSLITIRLPLTLAIIDGFLVQVGKTKYIIPLESIGECIELTEEEQINMQGNEFINLRGEMLPILDVREMLNEDASVSQRQNIVIVRFGEKMIGLAVDELLGEHQTVIKPLGDVFANVAGISGGSILGSGEVALIFDVARLIEYKI